MASQFKENGIRLEAQLAELDSKSPQMRWLLNEYYSTEKHATTALKYVVQHATRFGYIPPQPVKLKTQPTAYMRAYAARESTGKPLIYVNAGLRFFLWMLNYSLVWAASKNTVLGGQNMYATFFTIINGYWPPSVDLLSQMQAMSTFSEDEKYFITAWLPPQIFFVVACEYAHHIIWSDQQGSPPVHKVRLLTGKEIEVYRPSQDDERKADEIAFDIWEELDSTLSHHFQGFTAGGLGALLGYFRILEDYTQRQPSLANSHLSAIERYQQLKARIFHTGGIQSLQAMQETWTVAEIILETCTDGKELLWKGDDPLGERD